MQRQNLSSISLAVEKWIDERRPEDGRYHSNDEHGDADFNFSDPIGRLQI